jgi:Fe-S-cluster containining protein
VKRAKKRLPVVSPEFPPMQCDVGCGDCCGPAPATKVELDRVVAYVRENGIVPKDQGLTCPLFLDGACSVYSVRPLICRAFGHVEGMDCTRGYNVNVPSEALDEKLRMNGEDYHLLHEVLAIVNPGITFKGVLHQMARST